jgi:hypothetical protein
MANALVMGTKAPRSKNTRFISTRFISIIL